MGIRFNCPNGHKLNVKEFLAGKRGVCPQCGAKFVIPVASESLGGEGPTSGSVTLPQLIEISAAPVVGQPMASTPLAPSTVLPEAGLELAPPELIASPIPGVPPIVGADALPDSILSMQQPVVAPSTGVAAAVAPLPRERGRRNQVLISVLLLALVIVLAGVLIWVLKREASKAPAEKAPAEQAPTEKAPAEKAAAEKPTAQSSPLRVSRFVLRRFETNCPIKAHLS